MSSLTSCDDWLEVTPTTEVLADDLLVNEEGFNTALLGVYIGLTNNSCYGENLSWHFLEVLAQQYQITSGNYLRYAEYKFENSTIQNGIWSKQYNSISQANKILEMVELNRELLSAPAYNVIKGEALALRAFCHFDLLRLFGHGGLGYRPGLLTEKTIPYVLKHSKEITPQKTYEETFALLEADLAEALTLLKDDPINPKENVEDYLEFSSDVLAIKRKQRLNVGAVQLLQARAYLWAGKKTEALEAAEKAITFINEAGFAWASDAEINSSMFEGENLFMLDVQKLKETISPYYEEIFAHSPNPNLLWQADEFYDGIYDYTNEGQTDIRYMHQKEILTIQSSDGEKDGFLTIKLRSDVNSDQPEGINTIVPMLKMSEAYLIAAECYANGETPNLEKAIEYMNLLKDKRNIMPDYFLEPTADQNALNNEIFREYRKEFTQEGQLFYLYKRWGLESFPGLLDVTMTDAEYMLPYPDSEVDLGQR